MIIVRIGSGRENLTGIFTDRTKLTQRIGDLIGFILKSIWSYFLYPFFGWLPMGGKEYIASKEALRKEDFLQGRTFESSNSPRAGVKANNDNYKA